jgi:hypothetical protein
VVQDKVKKAASIQQAESSPMDASFLQIVGSTEFPFAFSAANFAAASRSALR